MSPKRKLTNKQKQFIKFYLVDYNSKNAAIKAGYSEKSADAIGSQNYAKLKDEIEIELAKVNEKVGASAEEAVRMCRDIALIDSRDYTDKRISKGIELYGRTQAAFVEKRETVHKFEGLTDAELDAKIKGIMGET